MQLIYGILCQIVLKLWNIMFHFKCILNIKFYLMYINEFICVCTYNNLYLCIVLLLHYLYFANLVYQWHYNYLIIILLIGIYNVSSICLIHDNIYMRYYYNIMFHFSLYNALIYIFLYCISLFVYMEINIFLFLFLFLILSDYCTVL